MTSTFSSASQGSKILTQRLFSCSNKDLVSTGCGVDLDDSINLMPTLVVFEGKCAAVAPLAQRPVAIRGAKQAAINVESKWGTATFFAGRI